MTNTRTPRGHLSPIDAGKRDWGLRPMGRCIGGPLNGQERRLFAERNMWGLADPGSGIPAGRYVPDVDAGVYRYVPSSPAE